MQTINLEELLKMEKPNPEMATTSKEVLRGIDFGAAYIVMNPHQGIAYHYHQKHESIFFIISGEATVVVEDKEYLLKKNDVMYVKPFEKHKTTNKSDKALCYLEFHIPSPDRADFVEVK